MTRERSQRLLLIAIFAVVICHASLIVGLALAGEWRVWRFITDFVAHLYGWAGLGWLTWQIVPPRSTASFETGHSLPATSVIRAQRI